MPNKNLIGLMNTTLSILSATYKDGMTTSLPEALINLHYTPTNNDIKRARELLKICINDLTLLDKKLIQLKYHMEK